MDGVDLRVVYALEQFSCMQPTGVSWGDGQRSVDAPDPCFGMPPLPVVFQAKLELNGGPHLPLDDLGAPADGYLVYTRNDTTAFVQPPGLAKLLVDIVARADKDRRMRDSKSTGLTS
ncbi:hypothetical protein AAIH70_16505 [Neorhizobium sp. BT27B]|uniref:hypothetical protein n=1 Tax=Neorhizobium sp. BT27B TaxID=3142625 RepID=UPI003D2D0548